MLHNIRKRPLQWPDTWTGNDGYTVTWCCQKYIPSHTKPSYMLYNAVQIWSKSVQCYCRCFWWLGEIWHWSIGCSSNPCCGAHTPGRLCYMISAGVTVLRPNRLHLFLPDVLCFSCVVDSCSVFCRATCFASVWVRSFKSPWRERFYTKLSSVQTLARFDVVSSLSRLGTFAHSILTLGKCKVMPHLQTLRQPLERLWVFGL